MIRNQARGIEIFPEVGQVRAESGAVVYPDLVEAAIDRGLSGLEHYVGIPSTVGGALWQNLHFLSPAPARERTMFIAEVTHSAEILTLEGGTPLRGRRLLPIRLRHLDPPQPARRSARGDLPAHPGRSRAGCAASPPRIWNGGGSATRRWIPNRAPVPSSRRSRGSAPAG